MKRFPDVDQSVSVAVRGAPVHVVGAVDTQPAITYPNHISALSYADVIVVTIHDDVQFGRFFVSPLHHAANIPGLRLPPLGVVASPSKTCVMQYLTFSSASDVTMDNAVTDFTTTQPCQLGVVIRDVLWRILYPRRTFGDGARIVLRTMDAKYAFRQVPVEWERSPTFGYVFRDLIVGDKRLKFGRRNYLGFRICFRRRSSMRIVTIHLPMRLSR